MVPGYEATVHHSIRNMACGQAKKKYAVSGIGAQACQFPQMQPYIESKRKLILNGSKQSVPMTVEFG